MKKKILLFIFMLIVACTLVASASAACTHKNRETTYVEYTSYIEAGTESFICPNCDMTSKPIDPLVTFVGYAISSVNDGICSGYVINQRALSQLLKQNDKFELGLVGAAMDSLGNRLPLNPSTAEPTDLSDVGAVVIKRTLPNDDYLSMDMIIGGISASFYDKKLCLSAYVFDGSQVFYLAKTQLTDTVESISFYDLHGNTEIKIEDMEYSLVKETELSADRLKQMASSNASYNTGSTMTDDQLNSIEGSAKVIIAAGELLGYKKATGFLAYYLSNTKEKFSLNMNTFLKDEIALKNRNDHINLMLRAAESLAIKYATVNINQAQERINHNLTGDWKYSLGSYFDDVDLTNLTVREINGEKVYSATVKYMVTDFYNWNESITQGFLNGKGPSQYELYQLHKAGLAREFLTYGEISYEITWKQGETVQQIKEFN